MSTWIDMLKARLVDVTGVDEARVVDEGWRGETMTCLE
jgi:hypothetical protein